MRWWPHSLKSKLLITVGLLALFGYALITLLVSNKYAQSLESSLEAQGISLAQSLSVQFSDLILINDLTAIQKLLDSLQRQHKLAYAFVTRSSKVLAHTFDKGMPQDLLNFNKSAGEMVHSVCRAKSFRFEGSSEVLLDVACPIYDGKAGVVHLGLSEEPVRAQLVDLWIENALTAALALLLMLAVVFVLLQRLASPLETLVRVTRMVGKAKQEDELRHQLNALTGQHEIAVLAASFQEMLERLEEKSRKVTRSNEQLLTCNAIITGVAAQPNLQEMGRFLLARCREILRCSDIALLFFDIRYNSILSISAERTETLSGHALLQSAVQAAQYAEKERTADVLFPPLVPERFTAYEGQMHIPILHENAICGLFVSGCVPGCRCDRGEMALTSLVLGQISGCLHRALEHEGEVKDLRERFGHADGFHGIVGNDPKMQAIFKRIEDVAPSDASVLIQGESGTGKELVAKAIHTISPRRDKPFVVINCAAYPDTLLESELFGHERGAFTGADKQRIGRFEQANGGTVFLDEIGEVAASAQVKLLRVLQERVIERLGGNKAIPINVRVIAASNSLLADAIQKGRFRDDLYYRLDVVTINLPPLRERVGDIPRLAQYFLQSFATEYRKELALSPAAMQLLLRYQWPGNIRELENCLAQAALLAADGLVNPRELPAKITGVSPEERMLEQSERNAIVRVLEAVQGNKKLAAARLGISRTTLYAKMKKFGIA